MYSLWLIVATTFLFKPLAFFCSLLSYYCQIFFVMYTLVLISSSTNNFHCLKVLHQFCYSSFPMFCCIQHWLLICTMIFHLCVNFFSTCIITCTLNSTYDFSHCDWFTSNPRSIFQVLIPVFNKVESFDDEALTFLCQKN